MWYQRQIQFDNTIIYDIEHLMWYWRVVLHQCVYITNYSYYVFTGLYAITIRLGMSIYDGSNSRTFFKFTNLEHFKMHFDLKIVFLWFWYSFLYKSSMKIIHQENININRRNRLFAIWMTPVPFSNKDSR